MLLCGLGSVCVRSGEEGLGQSWVWEVQMVQMLPACQPTVVQVCRAGGVGQARHAQENCQLSCWPKRSALGARSNGIPRWLRRGSQCSQLLPMLGAIESRAPPMLSTSKRQRRGRGFAAPAACPWALRMSGARRAGRGAVQGHAAMAHSHTPHPTPGCHREISCKCLQEGVHTCRMWRCRTIDHHQSISNERRDAPVRAPGAAAAVTH